MDSGPALSQETEPIRGEDTAETLSERLAVRGAALMAATLQRWLDGGIEPAPQDEGAVTFTKRLSREDGRIGVGGRRGRDRAGKSAPTGLGRGASPFGAARASR